ncbi:copper resistance protein CopC [Pengzhenrongella phosphoraccumulans]|uniref:copper resistance CopC family protein n=1 Tax=Pengzhenrongella phosphoraccumulans TaxID=3114394 RepID=UPI0038911526
MTTDPARATVRPWAAVARLVALAFTALVVVSAVAAPASAHDVLEATDPADGSTVETAPAAVVLTFSQEVVALGTEVQVVGPAGQPMNDGPVAVLGTVVTQNLAADRPAGAYTVQWRATSSDGHPTTGGFTFTATAAVVPATAPPAVAPTPTSPPQTPSATPSASEGTAVGPTGEATPPTEASDGARGLSVGAIIAGVCAFALAVVSANWWRRRRAGAPQ